MLQPIRSPFMMIVAINNAIMKRCHVELIDQRYVSNKNMYIENCTGYDVNFTVHVVACSIFNCTGHVVHSSRRSPYNFQLYRSRRAQFTS